MNFDYATEAEILGPKGGFALLNRMREIRRRYKSRQLMMQARVPLAELERRLATLAGRESVAICPTATGRHWQGVLSATEGLFDDALFQLPQYYSQPLYTPRELESIADIVAALGVRTVVVSGYLEYFDPLMLRLHAKGITVSIIYHGSHVSVFEDASTATHFKAFLDFAKTGVIRKVGLVKKGMDKTLRTLTGMNAYPIHLKTATDVLRIRPEALPGTHIGALTHGDFRKNIYNQVAAGLMVSAATVHMKEAYHSSYLGNDDRIVFHPHARQRREFLELLGSMTANLYVTYSECWGQLVTESLAMGVPCLASDVSAVLDFDPEMRRRLIVAECDNDYAIYQKLMEVVDDADWFRSKGPEYVAAVNEAAEATIRHFVAD